MNKTGYIESYIHDQGGGFSWCSLCDTQLDLVELSNLKYVCPGCGCNLEFGKISINQGGSDF